MLSRDEYENKLRLAGCQLLGNGCFANVFSVPKRPDRVIKVARIDGWLSYIQWVTSNGHAGKFAPKVYSLKFKGDYYIAVMERLVCTIGDIRDSVPQYGVSTEHVNLFRTIQDWKYLRPGRDTVETEHHELLAFFMAAKDARLIGDLHDGNAMVRHDGQIVITDPCSSSYDAHAFRIKNAVCL